MLKTGSSLVLALDLGTGGCKGALYSRDGMAWRFASCAYKLHSAVPGKIDAPGDLTLETVRAIRRACGTRRR